MSFSPQSINQQLMKINSEYQKLFKNRSYKSSLLTRKNFSIMNQKIYQYMELGDTQSKQKHKQLFLQLFRTYMSNFLNNQVYVSLQCCTNIVDFSEILSEHWANFKQLTFYYFALLQQANSHYQMAHHKHNNQNFYSASIKDTVFPVPVVALYLFRTNILQRYQEKIKNIILSEIKNQRQGKKANKQCLKTALEIIWCCGLSQIARIKISNQAIVFYKEERTQSLKNIKISFNPEDFILKFGLNDVLIQTGKFYHNIFNTKIATLSPLQQFSQIAQIIKKEEQFSNFNLFNQHQRYLYLNQIYKNLVLNDFQERIKKQNSLKTLIQRFRFDSDQGIHQIKTYFMIFQNIIGQTSVIKCLEKLIFDIILQQGNLINKKILKRKQHIVDMITLKKSIDRIIEQASNKNIRLMIAKDKAFKKILDGIQTSRNLADFTDFTIKQCIKLKLDQEGFLQKFKDIFLILTNITSTDSFALYHQQLLGKRLIQALTQPKLQIQIFILKKLSEQLGAITVSQHFSMIKDIQNSFQLSDKYSQKLPFSSYKWNLKIYNPSFWPDSLSKCKLKMQFPNLILQQSKRIQQLYHIDNQYRYLNWKPQKGVSLFEGRYKNKKFRFQSDNAYLMILLHIQEQQTKTVLYGNLKKLIKSQKNEKDVNESQSQLALYLHVLVQNRLLIRKNNDTKYQPFFQSEELKVNLQYLPPPNSKPGQTILIRPSPQMSKILHQSSIQTSKILKDRQKLIEAVLVKVLKHNHATGDNSVTFNQLYNSIKTHHILGNFNFSEQVVKLRLEELIARQYCERDENDRKIYHYLA